jgi:hypothetical protein
MLPVGAAVLYPGQFFDQGQWKGFFVGSELGAGPACAVHQDRHAETSVATCRKASESATCAVMTSDSWALGGSCDSVGRLTLKSTGGAGNGAGLSSCGVEQLDKARVDNTLSVSSSRDDIFDPRLEGRERRWNGRRGRLEGRGGLGTDGRGLCDLRLIGGLLDLLLGLHAGDLVLRHGQP